MGLECALEPRAREELKNSAFSWLGVGSSGVDGPASTSRSVLALRVVEASEEERDESEWE